MLSVEYIIYAISPADFNRVNLIEIKVFRSFSYVLDGKVTLIFLIRNKVFNWYLFKMYIWDIHTQIIHCDSPL